MTSKSTHFRALLTFSLVIATAVIFPHDVLASDPDPLQDFCVADLDATPLVNGYPCKAPESITLEDFAFAGLANAANLTGNPINGTATFGFVRDWPALNTLGLSLARLDINPGGIIMPHTHNLATEITGRNRRPLHNPNVVKFPAVFANVISRYTREANVIPDNKVKVHYMSVQATTYHFEPRNVVDLVAGSHRKAGY